jgi:hypothetical protein
MKQKDIGLIIVVVIVSGVFSIVLTRAIITSPKNRQETVPIVQAITSDFQEPSDKYFNTKSVDPTRLIKIGDSSNKKPFNDN